MAAEKITDEQVANVLDAALALMNDKGAHWAKGSFKVKLSNGQMVYCAVGGIQAAAPGPESQKLRDSAVVALAEELPTDVFNDESGPAAARRRIICWNDERARVWQDIRRAFTAASLRLRAK